MKDKVYKYEPFWGNWYVDSFIGEGSFGKVYKIKRTECGNVNYAALKIISIPKTENEIKQAYYDGMDERSASIYFKGIVDELYKEIDLMSQLKGSSNIVSYEDHMIKVCDNGIGYDVLIRMELLESLNEYFLHNPYQIKDIIRLGIDMCKALEMCQKINVIHRDIKPDNIFVSPYGDYKLGDFGIARKLEITNFGFSKKGTYTYMAPEVFKGESYDSRADLYSLGVLMYRFLNNNRIPFSPYVNRIITHGEKEIALQRRMSGEEIPMPEQAGEELGQVILKACAYEQHDRYQSPQEFRRELEKVSGLYAEQYGTTLQEPANSDIGETVLLSQNNPATGMNQNMQIGETVVLSELNPMDMQQGSSMGETVLLSQMTSDMQQNNSVGETVLLSQMQPLESENTAPIPEHSNNTYSKSGKFNAGTVLKNKKIMIAGIVAAVCVVGILTTGIITNSHQKKLESKIEKLEKELEGAKEKENERIAEEKKLSEQIVISKRNMGIKKLSTIENLSNAKELDISKNVITDIKELSQCKYLQVLYLNNNKVKDISPLAKITTLTSLDLGNNSISSVGALKNLTGLTSLGLENNQIKDITELSALAGITNLNLKGNKLKDIIALSKHTKLESLNISNNKVKDISIAVNLTGLKILHLENNQITDIKSLFELKNLTEVYLRGNKIPKGQIQKLKELNPNIYIEYK
ncbi:protein kinase domain-containing protein [Anaerosacchariphilus polymeriproducens]|uniref:Protein kinase domain-containing protein n=1 Tax=Anaerosacchariphilus polymeriproducens TaxID=1812858 RepID=A0A371AZW2_9FIRM|nr:leucine-rich repeat domain-containing protein [Anaerosacchariphilus polymeriproducens]RDU25148.1 hypothetical protein DWV06_01215 [Anaerosacchariphilus polymeriproducens]